MRNYGMDYETQIVPIGVHTVFSEDEEDLTFFSYMSTQCMV